jgi:single-stranded DNA-specific DHH superfamily exonuclease
LDLFLTEDIKEAERLAKQLDKYNLDRQKMQRDIVEESFEMIEQQVHFKDQKIIVLS